MDEEFSLEWDRANTEHLARHAVTPGEVGEVFGNQAVDLRYECIEGEDRWTSIGHTAAFRILVVVWTMRGNSVRPITAFDSTKRLAAQYLRERGL